MKNICFLFFTLLSFTSHAQEKKGGDLSQPAAIFVLSVNGKEYPLTEGQDLKLDGSYNNPSVSVKMANYRAFDNGSISFNYKSNATYQFDESTGSKTWTFSGSDGVVFLFELDPSVKLEAIVSNVVTQFGKKNCKVDGVSKRIGGKMVSGKQINVTIAGQKLVQEYYELTMSNSKTNILAFQNSKKEDGSMSPEGEESIAMVANSVKLGGH